LAFLGAVHQHDLTVLKLTELNGTKLTELDAAKNVGPELKLRGTRTKIIDLFCLIKCYLVDDHPKFVPFF
jgi:hypothetical protein